MTYLTESQKLHLKQIVELWDELGHAPSSAEFNECKSTPGANDLAFYFGTYKEGVELASHYRTPEKRAIIGAKPAPEKPEEPEEPEESPEEVPQAPETAPEKPSELVQEPQKPEELPKPEKQPEPPVKSAKSPQKKEATPMSNAICNYYSTLPLYFVSEDELSSIADDAILPSELEEMQERKERFENNGVAIMMSADVVVRTLSFPEGDSSTIIPLFSTFSEPKVVKDGQVYNFPAPQEGVFFFVDRDIAEAARSIGRDTDDLIFPIQYEETDSAIYVAQLGKL